MLKNCDEPPTLSTGQYIDALIEERDKWVHGLDVNLNQRINDLRVSLAGIEDKNEQALKLATKDIEYRVQSLEDNIKERLMMKDRWLDARFLDVERLRDADREQWKSLSDERMRWADGVLKQIDAQIKGEIANIQGRMDAHRVAHEQFHEIHQSSLAEFKEAIQVRLDAFQKVIETLREERAHFISRDKFDTQVDALAKQLDVTDRSIRDSSVAGESQTRELIDTAVSKMDSEYGARIKANTDRLDRMERNQTAQEARNRQSIIALGVILTLVEIFFRYS
jgi:hypothetical protein